MLKERVLSALVLAPLAALAFTQAVLVFGSDNCAGRLFRRRIPENAQRYRV